MRRVLNTAAALVAAVLFVTGTVEGQSLTGTWRFTSDTSVVSEMTLVLTETPKRQIVGTWTAVRAGCQPVTEDCRWRGTVLGFHERGLLSTQLVPRTPGDIGGDMVKADFKASELTEVMVSFNAGTVSPGRRPSTVGVTATFTKQP